MLWFRDVSAPDVIKALALDSMFSLFKVRRLVRHVVRPFLIIILAINLISFYLYLNS